MRPLLLLLLLLLLRTAAVAGCVPEPGLTPPHLKMHTIKKEKKIP